MSNQKAIVFLMGVLVMGVFGKPVSHPVDTLITSLGNLKVTHVGHGSLMLEFKGKTIHVDPWTKKGDYATFPKADAILITHGHPDHLDPAALALIRKQGTRVLAPKEVVKTVKGAVELGNGDRDSLFGISLTAVPAYNRVHKKETGAFWHPKGYGNGYLLEFGKTKILIAGDTENIPELKALKNIEVAFLPMNTPYTMTPEMLADLVDALKPKILFPYHTNKESLEPFLKMMEGKKAIDIRVRTGGL